ncbi:MAG: hypothetical protein A3G04_01285 [Candidatus Taylorbacteria bacterium RIFCSPLOWO2_12_FULL_44_9]|nr:MAG: hypothetical protein A3G04_01285 [Candidatus Taylorbacteria bacterium RIFCSPLOWO2_12_FULL_44_9]
MRKIRFKQHRGLILMDILVAMSLATIFVIVLAQSSANSRELFEFAKERGRLINIFENHSNKFDGMVPYESRTIVLDSNDSNYSVYSTTTLTGHARWYGNVRIQTDITIRSEIADHISSSTESGVYPRSASRTQSMTFTRVVAYPFLNINDASGTALCNVDFSSKDTIGSYGFDGRQRPQLEDAVFSNGLNPQSLNPTITPIILPIDPLIPLTDIEVRNGRAYISTDSSRQSDPDIFVVDIRDSSSAYLLSGINTGPGISSIALVGDRIFAAATSRVAQLQVIKMPDLANLIIESSYKLPLPYATATPPLGSAIFYDRGLIYLGTEKWEGQEFSVVDMSNPTRPIGLGGLEIGSKVGAIYVRDDVAYLAASDEKQLRAIDISNHAVPFLIDSFNPSGWERQEGKSLDYFEDRLSFGRTSGGFNIKQDHELFSWSDGILPFIESENKRFLDVTGGIYGIIQDRYFLYVISRQPDAEFQISDLHISTSTLKKIALPAMPQSLTCDNDSLYILAATAPVLYQVLF